MDYKNIELTDKTTQTLKDMLKFKNDNMSLYTLKLIETLEGAISVTQCCKSDSELLPTKKDFISELEQHQEKYKTAHTEKVNNAYALGFRHCFHFISDRVKIK